MLVFGFVFFLFFFFFYSSLLLSWVFEHDCLDACCFGVSLVHVAYIFVLYLFNVIEHVSHRKVL